MEVQPSLDHPVAGATLQQPEPYKATMPSHWANAHRGHAIQPPVDEATSPHPYQPLGLLTRPLPHRQESFCFSTKSWGQVDISH